MRKLILLFIALSAIYICLPANASEIRINQLGYYPEGPKVFVVSNTEAKTFEIIDKSGKSVFKGNLSSKTFWNASGEDLMTGNFSKFKSKGEYFIRLDDGQKSYSFSIKNQLYKNAEYASLKAFYFQRMSIPIDEKYAGIYHRPLGHPDTICFFHPSTEHTEGTKPSPGGWYDAGDYNKYIVNAGITLGFLLQSYELYPKHIADNSLNIPESGNDKSDLLDEVKFELDWMFTMQDVDGGVFFKLSNLKFDPFEMPDKAIEKRFFIGKSTTSALCFAANLAQASRVFKNETEYSNKLLDAAEKAWKWAEVNPNIAYKNPSDVLTGEYGDRNFDEEFFWAATELFITTGKETYLNSLHKYKQPFHFVPGDNWRSFLGELAFYSIIHTKNNFSQAEKEAFKSGIMSDADSLLRVMNLIPYRIPLNKFTWGSNSDIADGASVFANAYLITRNKKYLQASLETIDYIFGKNATGYSFLTGFGHKPVMNIHHRVSEADGIEAPIPGLLSGGPNADQNDKNEVVYSYSEPARSFMDQTQSFASNEVAINWNAPLFYMLSFFENEMK